jgi:hypothetical protein
VKKKRRDGHTAEKQNTGGAGAEETAGAGGKEPNAEMDGNPQSAAGGGAEKPENERGWAGQAQHDESIKSQQRSDDTTGTAPERGMVAMHMSGRRHNERVEEGQTTNRTSAGDKTRTHGGMPNAKAGENPQTTAEDGAREQEKREGGTTQAHHAESEGTQQKNENPTRATPMGEKVTIRISRRRQSKHETARTEGNPRLNESPNCAERDEPRKPTAKRRHAITLAEYGDSEQSGKRVPAEPAAEERRTAAPPPPLTRREEEAEEGTTTIEQAQKTEATSKSPEVTNGAESKTQTLPRPIAWDEGEAKMSTTTVEQTRLTKASPKTGREPRTQAGSEQPVPHTADGKDDQWFRDKDTMKGVEKRANRIIGELIPGRPATWTGTTKAEVAGKCIEAIDKLAADGTEYVLGYGNERALACYKLGLLLGRLTSGQTVLREMSPEARQAVKRMEDEIETWEQGCRTLPHKPARISSRKQLATLGLAEARATGAMKDSKDAAGESIWKACQYAGVEVHGRLEPELYGMNSHPITGPEIEATDRTASTTGTRTDDPDATTGATSERATAEQRAQEWAEKKRAWTMMICGQAEVRVLAKLKQLRDTTVKEWIRNFSNKDMRDIMLIVRAEVPPQIPQDGRRYIQERYERARLAGAILGAASAIALEGADEETRRRAEQISRFTISVTSIRGQETGPARRAIEYGIIEGSENVKQRKARWAEKDWVDGHDIWDEERDRVWLTPRMEEAEKEKWNVGERREPDPLTDTDELGEVIQEAVIRLAIGLGPKTNAVTAGMGTKVMVRKTVRKGKG